MNPDHFPPTETLDVPDAVLTDSAVESMRSTVAPLASAELPEHAHGQVKWPGPDPTRYGDWEKAGRCIDF